jgi:hypothetical protein
MVAAYDAEGVESAPAVLVETAIVGLTLTAAPPHIATGQRGTFGASPFGFDATPEFSFRRYSPATGWTTVQPFGSANTWSWTPSPSDGGIYVIEVWARAAGVAGTSQAIVSTGYFSVGDAIRPMAPPPRLDFDGDGQADPSVFRPSNGGWYALLSSAQYGASFARLWGASGDVPVPGDYDGDGTTDPAVFRPSNGTWYVLRSGANFAATTTRAWGISTDMPVPGDYDGDRKTDFAVFRPSTGQWFVLGSTGQTFTKAWGTGTDMPMPADYDGDGRTDMGLFRPSNGTWYVLQSSTQFTVAMSKAWGLATDKPVPADYDGDHRVDFAIYRPANGMWYVLNSGSGYAQTAANWGARMDTPTPSDFNGDGRAEFAVVRTGTPSTWFVWNRNAQPWGTRGDIALGMRF